jgi:hypothetical protein
MNSKIIKISLVVKKKIKVPGRDILIFLFFVHNIITHVPLDPINLIHWGHGYYDLLTKIFFIWKAAGMCNSLVSALKPPTHFERRV